MATSVAHPRGTLGDAELAQLAVAGDGHAFAELYDRHERRVYGFCIRMLGSPHDASDATQETFVRMLARLPALEGRELNFVAYTLATARNVCYDAIRAARTVEPTADELPAPREGATVVDIDTDPERFALLAAAREDVRTANAALPARQREVLALREVELLSYEEIGELMDLNRNAVAQLISRARLKLGELLRGSALSSVGPSSPECERALPLLALLQDAQGAPGELDWVRTHLAACETCRLSRAAMEEAGVSYRALGLLVPAAWLRHATIARAAEFVGADWSHVGSSGSASAGASDGASGGAPPDAVGESDSGLTPDEATPGAAPQAIGRRGKLAVGALLGFVLCLLLTLVLAGNLGHDASTRRSPAASSPPTPAAVLTVKPHGHEDKLTASHGRVYARPLTGSSGHATALAVSTAPAHSPALVTPARQHKRRHHGSTPSRRAPASRSPLPAATPVPPTTTTTSTQTTPPATPAPSTGSGNATTETTTSSSAGSTGTEGTGTTPTNPNNPAGPPGLVP
jgi:RNA polymerase sigma-70 factor (ECF subfamily)